MTEIRVNTIVDSSGSGPVDFQDGLTVGGKYLNDSAGAIQLARFYDSDVNPTDSASYYGLLWFDSSDNRLNIYTPIGWRTFSGANAAASSSYILASAERAVFAAGGLSTGVSVNMDYFAFDTTGNASDFGDQTVGKYAPFGLSDATYGVFGGGYTSSASINVIDYITISTPGNATDFGDLAYAVAYAKGSCDGTYGFTFGGGTGGASGSGIINYIQRITVATPGNATDFADFLFAVRSTSVTEDDSRAIIFGGRDTTGVINNISYYDFTGGTTTDFGDITAAGSSHGAVSDGTYAVVGGGYSTDYLNVIEYVTIQTPGNATDFGDLTNSPYNLGSTGNGTRGLFAGGIVTGGANTNVVQYITTATPGNATDFGDMTNSQNRGPEGVSGT